MTITFLAWLVRTLAKRYHIGPDDWERQKHLVYSKIDEMERLELLELFELYQTTDGKE